MPTHGYAATRQLATGIKESPKHMRGSQGVTIRRNPGIKVP
jgi:hypothetical protein